MRKFLIYLAVLLIPLASLLPAYAQDLEISGTILSDENGSPLPGVTVENRQTKQRTSTNANGLYTIKAAPGQQLVFSFVGYAPQTVTVSTAQSNISFRMQQDDKTLDNVVITALGISKSKRGVANAVSTVQGAELAQTQRDNILNSLAGRVPGVTISGTNGLPGSSTSIQLRGINSLSGSNQPLFVIDGLPVNNETFNANNLVTQTENRTVDFSNRIGDLNPEDIESLTILKGPEAAALYGIDAANGAIVVVTKKGKAGKGVVNYSYNYGIENVGRLPELPRIYARGSNGILNENTFERFGPRYKEGTQFYDNINNFFQQGRVQKHNISFEGGASGYTYRFSAGYSTRRGVVPNTQYDRLNFTLTGTGQISKPLRIETTLSYINTDNKKVSKGANSFFLGLLSFPADEDMSEFLTPGGSRKRLTTGTEIENPLFDVNKNQLRDRGNRVISNIGLIYDPFTWLNFTGRLGIDVASTEYMVLYHPESNRAGGTLNGSLDQANQVNRIVTLQYFATLKKNFFNNKLRTTLRLGSAVYDFDDNVVSVRGNNFLEPNFNSLNNTDITTQRTLVTKTQKRVIGAFGDLNINYNNLIYLTATGRNDWTSTLPEANNSFFYPSLGLSFVWSDLIKNTAIADVITLGRIRVSTAEVGKDARPYSTNPALQAQTTTGGGFGYNFTAPNPLLVPEKVTSQELGLELQLFKNRIGIDAAVYKSKSVDQIVNGLRISYGTGFILKNINGGELQNWGTELLIRGTPIQGKNFTWEISFNYTKTNSELTRLPEGVSEFYNSDTWLYGNVRNGARLGGPLTTLTASAEYTYNKQGQLLISPATGLPILKTNAIWPAIADRNPDWRGGVSNSFTYKGFNLNFLWDIKVGGDVFNGTGLYMYNLGLHPRSIADRETPIQFNGVLQDGLENTATPTPNNITIIPYYNNNFYLSSIIDQEFIERDVNWLRLRDITLSYRFPAEFLKNRIGLFSSAQIAFTATDLFLFTNYSGADPGVNGTTVATGGSGSFGIDYGNLPVSKTYNVNLRLGF